VQTIVRVYRVSGATTTIEASSEEPRKTQSGTERAVESLRADSLEDRKSRGPGRDSV